MATEVPHAAGNAAGSTADSPERIKAEIEQTRQQLGDTLERLVAKTDVKRRARAEVAVLASAARKRRVPLSIGAGIVFAAFSLALWQRSRQHGRGA
jgi:hypothetical protein